MRGVFVVAPATLPPARPIARSGLPESTQPERIGIGSSVGIPQPARQSLLLLFTLVAVGVAATIGTLYLIILAVGAIAYLFGSIVIDPRKKDLLWVMSAMCAQASWMAVPSVVMLPFYTGLRGGDLLFALFHLAGLIAYFGGIVLFMRTPNFKTTAGLFLYVSALLVIYLGGLPYLGLTYAQSKAAALQILIFAFVLVALPSSYRAYQSKIAGHAPGMP